MTYNSRSIPSHVRASSTAASSLTSAASSSGQSPALLARITEKRAELANLKELQALSANLADQMAQLEQKLSTLTDGTEAVAVVLGNWHNVLRAIGMAAGKLPKPRDEAADSAEVPLPQTLVRIPTQQAGALTQSSGERVT